jgi:hypothetical protein
MKWKPIPSTKGYYSASENGDIRRDKPSSNGGSSFGKIMKPTGKVYLKVNLTIGGKATTFLVHRLVAEAFHGIPNDGQEVNHIDCNKKNNRASNLEWCSEDHNKDHARKMGLMSKKAKLTIEEVRQIKLSTETNKSLAKKYSVTISTIWKVRHNYRWKSA